MSKSVSTRHERDPKKSDIKTTLQQLTDKKVLFLCTSFSFLILPVQILYLFSKDFIYVWTLSSLITS